MISCIKCKKELLKTQKKFCCRACAVAHNNTLFPKRKKNGKTFNCLNCFTSFFRRAGDIAKGHTLYCCTDCMHAHRRLKTIDDFNAGKIKNRPRIRKILFKLRGVICSVCNLKEWSGQPIPLNVDHIDGNASNNIPDNLRLICLNCDALNSTYAGKNKGHGRKSLGLRRWD